MASYESVQAIAAVLDVEPSDLTVAAPPSSQAQEGPGEHANSARDRAPGNPKGDAAAVVLAIGVLGGTGTAVLAPDPLWWAGALVLACAIVFARVLSNESAHKGGILRAVYLATTCFLALTLVAYADPAWVAMMIPILGGASVVVLDRPLGCLLGRRRNHAST